MRRFILSLGVVLASLAIGAFPALADSCANVSRAAPAPTGPGPVIRGNWVWLPSIGVDVQAWGFAPPGTTDSTAFSFPGANGNYTNGQTSSLLGVSAICTGSVAARQTTNGIQSGCE